MARKKKKQRPVYRKGRSKFIKKLKSAAEKYDEYLEKTRSGAERVKEEFGEAKEIVGKEFRKTGEVFESVRRPIASGFQRAAIEAQRSVAFKPVGRQIDNKQIAQLQKIKSRELWTGKSTRGLTNGSRLAPRVRGRLPRLF